MNLVFEYIKYRWNAKGRHGTHSPFVYKFVDECIPSEIQSIDKLKIQTLIARLKKDTRKISVQDFGAGSKTLKNSRKIKEILRISSSKGKYAKLFYKISQFYQLQSILEFGTSLGIGTIHFALGSKQGSVSTVEACPRTARVAMENFAELQLHNIQLHNQTFVDFIQQKQQTTYDLLFIDGHHDGQATIDYVNQLYENTHKDTFIILDDIRWSSDMFKAWEILRKDDRFHVSMDLFRMGILLRRPGQRKEHFVVKL